TTVASGVIFFTRAPTTAPRATLLKIEISISIIWETLQAFTKPIAGLLWFTLMTQPVAQALFTAPRVALPLLEQARPHRLAVRLPALATHHQARYTVFPLDRSWTPQQPLTTACSRSELRLRRQAAMQGTSPTATQIQSLVEIPASCSPL